MDTKPLNRIKVVMAETNKSQPTLESLIEIAKALKCDISDLVRMDDSTILKNQD